MPATAEQAKKKIGVSGKGNSTAEGLRLRKLLREAEQDVHVMGGIFT